MVHWMGWTRTRAVPVNETDVSFAVDMNVKCGSKLYCILGNYTCLMSLSDQLARLCFVENGVITPLLSAIAGRGD